MIPIEYLRGDATNPVAHGNGDPRVIVHVCNDLGGWGAGFVLALSAKWKEPETTYRDRAKHNMLELGQVDIMHVDYPSQAEGRIYVANMVAQHGYRSSASNPVPLDYNALAQCLARVRTDIWARRDFAGFSVHMPRIGCGLAGGTWDKVEPIIIEMLSAYDVPVYVYDLEAPNADSNTTHS